MTDDADWEVEEDKPPPAPRGWKDGERCFLRIPSEDATRLTEAVIMLASPNGRSLIVAFDAMLHGHLGMMPLLWRPSTRETNFEAGYWTLFDPVIVELLDP